MCLPKSLLLGLSVPQGLSLRVTPASPSQRLCRNAGAVPRGSTAAATLHCCVADMSRAVGKTSAGHSGALLHPLPPGAALLKCKLDQSRPSEVEISYCFTHEGGSFGHAHPVPVCASLVPGVGIQAQGGTWSGRGMGRNGRFRLVCWPGNQGEPRALVNQEGPWRVPLPIPAQPTGGSTAFVGCPCPSEGPPCPRQ